MVSSSVKERRQRRPRQKRSTSSLLPPPPVDDEADDALLPESKRKMPDITFVDDMPAAEKAPIDAEEEMRTKPLYQQWSRKFSKSLMELLGEDWLYLVLLGVVMGFFSFAIDIGISKLRFLHFYIFRETDNIHWTLQYTTWVLFSLVLILASAALCHFIAPQAGGSGIPELKTILRGVVLKEYLTFRTLVTKLVGLVMALGSGLPLGKEGPFVHIASMLARLLSKLVFSFQGIYENESRSSEMLAAAAAVGVASTYGAAVGGVLFSIEVTSVFFPLRNYWRGFLATVSSAVVFRLLAVWFEEEQTVVAFSTTSFPSEYPFDPKELIVFVFLGIICGFAGALFVWFHRKYVTLVLQNKRIKAILEKSFIIYPAVVTFVIASLKCPLGYGKFFAGGLTPREALGNLFSNFSWNDPGDNNTEAEELLAFWAKGTSSIFVVLALYALNMFWMTAIAITLPIPCGVFIPIFVTGAAFGRLIGETMYILFPNGVRTDGIVTKIVPGAYALVGATAFSGAVTHAISVSVIVVEITGQIIYILPITLAVLLANAVCARLQPSIYDSIIRLKKLPYLPRILPTSSSVHKVYAGDICVRDMKFLSLSSTYREVQDLLIAMPKLKSFPLVDRPSSCILLGSIRRGQMEKILEEHVGEHSRHIEAGRRRRETLTARFVPTTIPVSKEADEKLLQAISADDPPVVMRKESRFQIRRVLSQDALSDPRTSVGAQRKNAIQLPRASDQSSDQPSKLTTVRTANLPLQHMDGMNGNGNTTVHSVSASKFLNTVHAVGNYMHSLPHKLRMSLRRGVPTVHHYDIDLSPLERKEWENQQLEQRLDFDKITIDPAPFQLVERTSLYKVHSLFWLLGLNRAYVTCLGRLVGVVALRELRQTLEKAQPCNQAKPRRKATFDGSMMQRPQWRQHRQRLSLRPQWMKTSSLRSRLASIAPSVILIPGQSEAINVSLPSTPDSVRRADVYSENNPLKEGDCLSEVDEDEMSEGDKSRGDILSDDRDELSPEYYSGNTADGPASDSEEDGDDGDDDDGDGETKGGAGGGRDNRDSYYSAV